MIWKSGTAPRPIEATFAELRGGVTGKIHQHLPRAFEGEEFRAYTPFFLDRSQCR